MLTPKQVSSLSREELETKFIMMYDALDHINRVSKKSRTATRRHSWMQARADCALRFEEWTYPDLGLGRLRPRKETIVNLHSFDEEPKDSHKFFIVTENDILKIMPLSAMPFFERIYRIEGTSIRSNWNDLLSFKQISKGWIYEHELVDYFIGK
ncbi:hypothetical protein [Neisseria sp. Ec49-e6-T10]|uniref:hypothetical protein n=1 Tax=Neisseria sp. Ec49-e6-T10 TaxID=3140744 RepID=UPI003EBD2D6C